eukprot:scaffold12163_cov176-Amphora_coffeaeformis.AAC.10
MVLSPTLNAGFVATGSRKGQPYWRGARARSATAAGNLFATPLAVLADASVVDVTTSTTTNFEPVLNIPAFGSFFFIAVVFGFLQYRIAAIGAAAERRTAALVTLRELKSLEIAGKDISAQEMERAKDDYRTALEEVENLRTVIPGLARIAPPPSESENRQRMEENVAAAKQFLDLDISSSLPPLGDKDDKEAAGLSPLLVGILVAVGLSQIALLVLFVFGAADPTNF